MFLLVRRVSAPSPRASCVRWVPLLFFLGPEEHCCFDLHLLDTLLSKGVHTVKTIPPKCRLGFSRVLKETLDKVIRTPEDISCWDSLLVLPLCLLKTFAPRSNMECRSAIRRQRQEGYIANAIRSWSTPGGRLLLVREVLAEPPCMV